MCPLAHAPVFMRLNAPARPAQASGCKPTFSASWSGPKVDEQRGNLRWLTADAADLSVLEAALGLTQAQTQTK